MNQNTLKNITNYIKLSLADFYPEREIEGFIKIINTDILGFSTIEILLNQQDIIDTKKVSEIEKIIAELKQFKPIQYIIGKTDFYGLTFNVTPDVLIPRPETEELVDWVCKDFAQKEKLSILDIGTGSGCIAISLKNNFPSWSVSAIDISPNALKTAEENAKLNNVNINFIEADILNPNLFLNQTFDLIISNPPYVMISEKSQMQQNVLDHEPHSALFVSNNQPLVFYEAIVQFAIKHLSLNGNLFFEINENLAQKTSLLLKKYFKNIEIRKDLNNKDRMIRIK